MGKRTISLNSTILVFALGLLLSGTSIIQAQTATHRTPLDFDGDGKTDIALARASLDNAGYWYWWIRSSLTEQQMPVVQFGRANPHLTIPADYDGDGKTDIAVFQKNTTDGLPTHFFVLRSSDSRIDWIQWGLDSDNPYLTQDFDGDGKADPTVVRCLVRRPNMPPIRLENWTWFILESSSNYQSYRVETFGKCDESRDRPIRGDFDGDGKADLAFFRELDVLENGQTRTANRYYMRLSGRRNFVRKVNVDFFRSGSGTLQGDFDGDGKTDIAAISLVGGGDILHFWWHWIRSSDGQLVEKQFGYINPDFAQRDVPVPGDYDGDGKTDVAIYRVFQLGPDQAFFYMDGSQEGFKVVPWGLELPDTPIANIVYVQP